MTDEEMWATYAGGAAAQKDMGATASTVGGDWTNVFGQDGVWETVSFQRNIDVHPYMRAMQRSAVGFSLAVQCADVKAQDIAKAEMALWKRRGRQWVEVQPGEHWLAQLLATAPNDLGQTWTEFWRMVLMFLDLTQDAYVLKEITRAGDIVGLIPIPTHRVRQRVTSDGALFYEIFAGTEYDRATLGDTTLVVPASQMVHFMGRSANGVCGLSNMTLGEPIFGLMGAISEYQQRLFQNEGRQQIVFESDTSFGSTDLGDAAFRRLKNQLNDAVRKMANSGDPILLEAGYKAKIIAQNARDAMTIEAYNAMVSRVCGLMRLPAHKIGAMENVKYENLSAMNADYANSILVPIANLVRDRMRLSLLSRAELTEYSPEFDQLALMAGDPATLMDLLDKGLKDGVVSINEARVRLPLGLQPIKGGDVRLIPTNFAIVDEEGDLVMQAAEGQMGNTGQAPAPNQPQAQPPKPKPNPKPVRGLELAVNNP
jgi:HK97 family phage portal protein